MTVVLDIANGQTEIFDNGKRIAKRKRAFSWWDRRFTFNSYNDQQKVKELQEMDG